MMTFEEAIKILELSPNFTEEELKSAYKRLTVKYHPDKHGGTPQYDGMMRKQQLINEAREFLKKYKKTQTKTETKTQETFDLNNYVKDKIKTLKNIIAYNTSIEEEVIVAYNNIKEKIRIFQADTFNTFVLSKQDIDRQYKECQIFIKKEFESLKSVFCKKHYIDETEIKETIDYDCSLQEFYDQLLDIEIKYSKIPKIIKRLEAEIEVYKSYVGYEKLKLLVNVCKNNTLQEIKKSNFKNIEIAIQNMHQTIKTEVFETHFSIQSKLSDLKNIVDTIDDESIKNTHQDIVVSFEKGSSFFDTEEKIKKLEKMIEKYQEAVEKKVNFQKNEPFINNIYESLITRYRKSITKYNFATDFEIVRDINEFFTQVVAVFTQGCQELKELDFFEFFNEINFENINNDIKLLKSIIVRLNVQRCRIYIKRGIVSWYDGSVFYWLDENDMKMYNGVPNKFNWIEPKKISLKELETEYISLEEFLKQAIFVGEYKRYIASGLIKVLYKWGRYTLYYENGKFHIQFNKDLNDTYDEDEEGFEQFKDHENICMLIEEQIKNEVYQYEKENPGQQYGFIEVLDKYFKNFRPNEEGRTKKSRKMA